MPAASPTSLAAVSGPQPWSSSRVGARPVASAPISRSSPSIAMVSSRMRTTRSRAKRATRPGSPARRDLERVEDMTPVEATGRGLLAGRQLVEVPAQAALGPRALGHEVLAVVDQEAQLALGAVEAGDRQVGLAQGGTGDRERVDGIALARLADRAAGTGHELGRHADDRLTREHEVALQAPGQMAAVLERPAPLAEARRAQRAARGGPRAWRATVRSASLRPCSSTATTVWVRLCKSAPIVTMSVSPPLRGGGPRTGRRTRLSGGEATLLSSHAGRSDVSDGRHNR